jgi:hypothetical protein
VGDLFTPAAPAQEHGVSHGVLLQFRITTFDGMAWVMSVSMNPGRQRRRPRLRDERGKVDAERRTSSGG